MSDPAISVVLPTFNHLSFLPDAVEDILRQTRGDWELIVVNDGSTDGSAAWLDAQRHPRLRVIHQENRGAAEAINTGIRAARGHYVTWVSADNRCTPYFLEALAAPLDLHPECVLSYSPFFGIDGRGTVHSLKHNNLLLLRELVSNAPRGNAGFLYRRAVHEAVGDYESWVCDTLMWSRILDGRRSVFVLEPTYYYRFHDDRATVRHAQAIEEERHRIMAEFLQRHGPDVDGEMLVRLYPALSQLPAQVGEAATDFSLRLFANGFPEQAVRLQLRLLSTCAPEGLLRPLQALLSCAAPQWDELDAPARMALDANRRLSPEQRQHTLGMARAAAAAAQAGLGLAPPVLEPAHPLLTREQPLLFSFCAWKAGMAGGALPGF